MAKSDIRRIDAGKPDNSADEDGSEWLTEIMIEILPLIAGAGLLTAVVVVVLLFIVLG